ncbi:acyl-CoA ligase (AMP-forming), exosortase A-associated [Duganella sp. CF517]|uniref:acyl-CoA ligase (AMP-forming), exosortase A system-associated n=1 Tax=Duganella sp. CF517 TaxID=1881038 RepID=UPI0008CDD719|nr:acyl-CoA ligase (AMP-forming), exosortase A system-associated [Duganella sp. CF517]SEN85491.1 acyl-CoA ligase (AMP-forming), exosortase A-associated [Duganella sp. CF517]
MGCATSYLVHDFIFSSAERTPAAEALVDGARRLTYAQLASLTQRTCAALRARGARRGERVAVYMEKNIEHVAALFGAAAAGMVFVPVNPLLKPEQVAYILRDCDVRVLVTSADRLRQLAPSLGGCDSLHTVLALGAARAAAASGAGVADIGQIKVLDWEAALAQADAAEANAGGAGARARRITDSDVAAILYTSGSTGQPKGVVLSHRNLVAGAASVASYLGNTAEDRILAVLPLSFDYGLSQLTTAFLSGACAVLINHLLPRDVLTAVIAERITGLAGVPPLWIQLAALDWPTVCTLRYLTNSGGAMPRATLDQLRARLPAAKPYLMYGLTEAFRSTFLPPSELDRRPDSMGKAIPNAEVLVLRPDGSECAPGEPGELVHRGPLVSLGYWNDAARTAERFKPYRSPLTGLMLPEMAVWSGDTVRRDEDGFLYFISRADEMIKTSGYRVSPGEVEAVLYAQGEVAEAAALGVPHPVLGQAIVVVVSVRDGRVLDEARLLAALKPHLPNYMLPHKIILADSSLPRNANGKIDRKLLSTQYLASFTAAAA